MLTIAERAEVVFVFRGALLKALAQIHDTRPTIGSTVEIEADITVTIDSVNSSKFSAEVSVEVFDKFPH
jgi:hypothetical protein